MITQIPPDELDLRMFLMLHKMNKAYMGPASYEFKNYNWLKIITRFFQLASLSRTAGGWN